MLADDQRTVNTAGQGPPPRGLAMTDGIG